MKVRLRPVLCDTIPLSNDLFGATARGDCVEAGIVLSLGGLRDANANLGSSALCSRAWYVYVYSK
jgi:hypothetical protein